MPSAPARRAHRQPGLLVSFSSTSVSSVHHLDALSRAPRPSTMPLPRELYDPSNSLFTPPRLSREFFREGSESAAVLEDIPSPCEDKPDDELAMESTGTSHIVRIGQLTIRLSNGVQRFLSALALAPLITYFLWRSPVFATTTVCALVVSVSCYEYAWLAHRIHARLESALDRFEADPNDRRSPSSTRSTSSRSNGPTQPSSGRPNALFPQPLVEERIAASGQRCAVTRLAARRFCGYEWLAAAAVSVVGTAVSTSIFTLVASRPVFAHLDFGSFRLYYSIISSFTAWLCACFTPDWRYGTLLIIEKEVFMMLTLYSMKCPINNLPCAAVVHPSMLMLGGILAITVFRILTTRTSAARLFFHLMLDTLGFVYIIGTLFFIVSFVDLDRETTYRKLVIALLYVVWAADSGAYFFGKLLEACNLQFSHPLASHLSARKDYEGTFIAILFGIGAMFLSSHWLHINGSVCEKLFFAAAAVVVGRIGDLFESLLKRAAMVKDSGMLIPGHGGVLDRIDALMFASIVFSRYFGAIIYPDEPRGF